MADIVLKPPEERIGFIDYNIDFDNPKTGASFHWWNSVSTTMHYHNHYEFFLITKGKTDHILNGESYVLTKNTLCFIKPNDVHQLIASDENACQHINIAVTAPRLSALCAVLSPDMQEVLDNSKNFSTVLSESELTFYLNCAEQINMCKNNYHNGMNAMTLLINEMLINALVVLYQRKQNIRPEHPEWFGTLLEKMHSVEYMSQPVSALYHLSHYSPPMLIKYFKEYTGETIVSMFTKIKINYACSLLETTNFTVLDIAGRLNYDSLSHFNRIFKRCTGLTPSEYRKQNRNL